MKKDTFLKGAFILGGAGIVVKILGAFFRIPLGNIIGSEGLGYYQVGYPIFTFLLAFSASGFPTAISKLVSEKRAEGDHWGAHRVFKISFYLLLAIGAVSSLLLAFGTRFLVNTIFKSPNAYYAVLALAPALFFIPMMAAFRGYFQGMKNMTPTAISQVVEQIGRVLLGLLLAVFLLKLDIRYAAAGASFGATIGGISGLLVIALIYYKNKKKIFLEFEGISIQQLESPKQIIKDLLKIALPITIGASVMPLINLLDTFIVLRRLQAIGFTYMEANRLYGQLTGMAATLVNLPQVFTLALAMSLVPTIAESAVKKDLQAVKQDTQSGVRMSLLLGLPATAGLAILSTPIMQLLFPNEPANVGEILLFMSLGVLFLTQVQTLTGILQGMGKPNIPVYNLMIGAATKLVVTYVLTGIPALNVKGAALGTVSAYLVATLLNYRAVKQVTETDFDLIPVFIKPSMCVVTMGVFVWITYSQLAARIGNNWATVMAIAVGVAVYGIMLLITKTVTKEDFDLIPGGKRVSKIFNKMGLMK